VPREQFTSPLNAAARTAGPEVVGLIIGNVVVLEQRAAGDTIVYNNNNNNIIYCIL